MNIKQHYHTCTKVYISQIILIAFLLSGGIMYLETMKVHFLLKIGMICMASMILLFFVGKYIYFIRRYSSVQSCLSKPRADGMEETEYVILFEPSPTLKLKLFGKDGLCHYYLMDKHTKWWSWLFPPPLQAWCRASYLVKKRDGQDVSEIHVNPRKLEIMTIVNRLKTEMHCIENKRHLCVFGFNQTEKIKIVKETGRYHFYLNDHKIAELTKGWMSTSLQKIFPLNTQMLSFHEKVNQEERVLVFALLTGLWSNKKN
ncbi:hypothetical protein [Falsibacillus albus]|uniref:Uncharacterized protein n=1 Tax=Falsibacillus albus TaxID=2478915 RepID=A0A3L7JWJ3_9BACI|nr:hypothetical protein [Falsibacillus albus]RLQ95228.1 hypothetical protein D9X91_12115 [Falsibacillus albus]